MGGATLMAAQAAGRVGAGLVSLATRPEHLPAVLARCPEVMASGISSGQDLEPMLARASVIVVGPGLGQAAWSEQVLRAVLATDKLLVVDADALNLIARGIANHCHRDNWIITPHPGEAARLLGLSTADGGSHPGHGGCVERNCRWAHRTRSWTGFRCRFRRVCSCRGG